ncbi:MAG TPA: Flp pilus assembly protein CpaB [Hellea balneolensis]|uniref:Flp pilus assembly protein CpaB n=1 Tax=Hellea balneolensis TaxID=287478 RepID=A0A7C5R7Y8_9PROT|nr:Flp pilus assembly protein CpaB [Hellea balneolensis]
MDKKKIILLGVLGMVAVVGFLQLQKMTAPAPVPVANPNPQPAPEVISTVEYVDILVAAEDIPRGTRLNQESFRWEKWPAEALNDNLIDNQNHPTAMDEMAGAVAKTQIFEGEPIMDRKVVHPGDRSQMSAMLKPGMRAISVEINANSAAGGFILPGDRVDVVLTSQVRNQVQGGFNGAQNNFIANTIFENVNVLAVDQIYGQAPDGTANIIGATAVLELSPNDAEQIIEAQSRGEIALVLRGLENRAARFVPSAATTTRKKSSAVSSMTIYRNGQPQQVAIQGQ